MVGDDDYDHDHDDNDNDFDHTQNAFYVGDTGKVSHWVDTY